MKINNADKAVATVTGLEVGEYQFTLTVTDDRKLQSSDTVKVIVREGQWAVLDRVSEPIRRPAVTVCPCHPPEKDRPPVAWVLSSPPVSLPVRTAALDGSRSSDDKGGLSFLWSRDDSSPAAGVRRSAPPAVSRFWFWYRFLMVVVLSSRTS